MLAGEPAVNARDTVASLWELVQSGPLLDPARLEQLRAQLGDELTLVRAALLLCALGYVFVAYAWLRPDGDTLRRALMATAVQMWVGFVLDIGLVRAGAWRYRDMPLTIAGVPLDLHLDWSLLWGLSLCWLSQRWPGPRGNPRQWALLLGVAVAATVAFDVAIHEWMLFLDGVAPWWMVADVAFLTLTLGLTLWVFHSVPTPSSSAEPTLPLPPLTPRARAWLYLIGFNLLFFLWLPGALHDAAASLGWSPQVTRVPVLPAFLALLGLSLGLWSVDEFALRGGGTPVPWDAPPRLVTSGPFALVANPMQISGMLLAAAACLHALSWVTLMYVANIAITVQLTFLIVEPRALHQRFGTRYSDWRASVRLWLPHVVPVLPLAARPTLFFDADCALCRAWVATLRRLDLRGSLSFKPLASSVLPAEPASSRAGATRWCRRDQRELVTGPLGAAVSDITTVGVKQGLVLRLALREAERSVLDIAARCSLRLTPCTALPGTGLAHVELRHAAGTQLAGRHRTQVHMAAVAPARRNGRAVSRG
ncbi:MAG: hypothetical protein DRQ55_15325, partial [Planctomycetota bacterium]